MMGRIFTISFCFLFLSFFLNAGVFSGEHVETGFLSGYFRPSQLEFREIYGDGYPNFFFLSLKIKDNLFFSTGYESIDFRGKAIGEGEEDYPLRFKMRNIPVSVFYRFKFGKVESALGIGLIQCFYKEKWESISLEYSGSKRGYMGFTGLEIPLTKILSFVGSLRFERIYSEESAFSKRIDLGGFKALFGISIKVI